MLDRCRRPNNHAFASYGARGIKVCQRWHSFENFAADMGERPSTRHSLDRIDNNGSYEPGNVRWATPAEQVRNTRRSVLLTMDGKTLCVADWATELGISRYTLYDRLRRGWTPSRTLKAHQ